jgi:hypothetical protein
MQLTKCLGNYGKGVEVLFDRHTKKYIVLLDGEQFTTFKEPKKNLLVRELKEIVRKKLGNFALGRYE